MKSLSGKLLQIIEKILPVLTKIPEKEWTIRPAPDKWCKQEILGHLIDSAANNHQRIVRVQYEENPFIVYDQNLWIHIQHYHQAPVNLLISLWENYNRHLAFIMAAIPEEKRYNLCDIKKEKPVTLLWLITDYIRHLEHHLKQLTSS